MDKETVKAIIERYPFLLPRNVWTDKVPDDYDYTYIKSAEIPEGWRKLFFQMCEDIREPLIQANCLDTFRFSQIKEKYNRLCCYTFGAPEEVQDILDKYGVMARYICTRCGKPATHITSGYIASFCEDCWKEVASYEDGEMIKFRPFYKVTGYQNGQHYEETISFQNEWDRYLQSLK